PPAAMRLGQTIRFPCSRIMGVLPSLVDDPRQCTVRVTHCATEQGGKGSASDVAGRSTLKDREIRLALRHRAAARRLRQLSSAHPTRPRRATARGRRSLLRARTEMRGSSCSPEKGRSIVEPAAVSPFAAWENFYVIVGSSAAALAGLPVLEDWLWHCAFPLVAYVTLLVAAFVLQRDPPRTLLVIGATALFLLFIGIHNAWDAVTYIATQQPQHEEGADRKKGRSASTTSLRPVARPVRAGWRGGR